LPYATLDLLTRGTRRANSWCNRASSLLALGPSRVSDVRTQLHPQHCQGTGVGSAGIASHGFAVPSSRARFLEVQSKGGDTHVENDDAPSECGKDHCFVAFDTLTHPTSLRLYGVFHSQWIARTSVRLHIQGLLRIDGVIKFRISSLTLSSGYVHTLYRLESHSTFSVRVHFLAQ
jgi:hypothetical protein